MKSGSRWLQITRRLTYAKESIYLQNENVVEYLQDVDSNKVLRADEVVKNMLIRVKVSRTEKRQ